MDRHFESIPMSSSFEQALQHAAHRSGRPLRELQIRLHMRTRVSLAAIQHPSALLPREVAVLLKELRGLVPEGARQTSAA